MKEHTLKFTTGDTRCWKNPGQYCRFLVFRRYGSISVCSLYSQDIADQEGLTRLDDCLKEFP